MLLSVVNPIAGVGKTTVSLNLAASLATAEQKVLLIETTPQKTPTGKASIGDVLFGKATLGQAINPFPTVPKMDVISADYDLSQLDLHLLYAEEREQRLWQELQRVEDEYDFIIMDSPSALGLMTINILVATQGVIVPISPASYTRAELQQLIHTFAVVRENMNKRLFLAGMVLNMLDEDNEADTQVEMEVRRDFGKQNIFAKSIANSVSIVKAGIIGIPVLFHDAACAGAQAYLWLAQTLLDKDRLRGKA